MSQLPTVRKKKHGEVESEQSPIALKLNTALGSYRHRLGTAPIDEHLVPSRRAKRLRIRSLTARLSDRLMHLEHVLERLCSYRLRTCTPAVQKAGLRC
jgi:hypothetical protein